MEKLLSQLNGQLGMYRCSNRLHVQVCLGISQLSIQIAFWRVKILLIIFLFNAD